MTLSSQEATSESGDSDSARIPERYVLVRVEKYEQLLSELEGLARKDDQQDVLLEKAAVAVATTQSLVLSEPAWKEKEILAAAGGKKKMEAKQASRAPGVHKQRVFMMDDSSSALEEECQREYKNLLRRAVRQEKNRLTLLAAQAEINRLAR